MRVVTKTTAIVCLTAVSCSQPAQITIAQFSQDRLKRDFISPPDSAKPRVWWHWMNGNITKEGIKLALSLH